VADVFSALAGQYETDAPILTMGGSIFPDRVVTHMSTVTTVPKTRSIVRSGCYITHDHGIYARTSPIAGLVPAVSVRAIVLSTPEPGVAVVGAGRRELPDDAGMPVVLAAASAGHIPRAGELGHVDRLFDHHAVLRKAFDLQVTDIVNFGISHPCSAFSRWPSYLVTRNGGVIERWLTRFAPH